MSTDSLDNPANPLLRRLVDDAGIFPPGDLPLSKALHLHRINRTGPYSALLGRFLCRASQLDELRELVGDDRLALGLIMDTGIAGLPETVARAVEDSRLSLEAVEIPLPSEGDLSESAHATLHALQRTLPQEVAAFVEIPRVPGWRNALALVAARGRGVKLRTGGLVADAFPTEREVADFVKACVVEGAAFKCTAGLHHAVRHTDETTGFEHHGFLNILLATCEAVRGASVPELIEVLAERDPAELADRVRALDARAAETCRRYFVAYGSCSFTEPVDDLTGLGLLEKETA